MAMQSEKRLVLVATESTYGVDASPTGSDAMWVSELNPEPMQADTVARPSVRPYMGGAEQFLTNIKSGNSFGVELAGSGTAGTAPKHGRLIQACGFAATAVASAVTGTATAGTTSSITLAVGASSVNDFYTGMILRVTAGAGSGSICLVTGYVGSTKAATVTRLDTGGSAFGPTSLYSIDQQTLYTPASGSFGSCSIYTFVDKVLHKSPGNRGTFSLSLTQSELASLAFTMTGLYIAPTDTTFPSATYSLQATPRVVRQGNTGGYSLMGHSGCFHSLSLDIGNQVNFNERPGCTKEVSINQRSVTGTIVIEAPTIAEKDFWTEAANDSNFGNLSLIHGSAATNIVGTSSARAKIGTPSYTAMDGIQMMNIPFSLPPSTAGNDELRLTFA